MLARRTLLAGLLAMALPSADADVLVLRSGDVHVGELVRRTPTSIVFRTKVDGVWTDLTLEAHVVDRLFEDPGHQADASAAASRADPALEDAPVAAEPLTPVVAVVPLHGRVGGLVEGSVKGTFDARLVEHALDRAAAAGARAVVLDIHSPGGLLSEMEAICEVIVERSDELRIIAYPGDALSAAAVIALTCPELVVRGESRVGAAVMVRPSNAGLSAVDAKLASPHHARQRQYMAAAGRPYGLLAAMTIQERQLWWSPAAGLIDRPEVAADTPDARAVDGATTVLTMLGDDAVRWGVAIGRADEPEALPAVLDLDEARLIRLDDVVEAHVRRVDQRVRRVLEQFGSYFQSLGRIQQTLVRMQRSGGIGRDQLRRTLGEAQRAARVIRRQDEAPSGDRTDLPDVMIEQLIVDADALARIAASIRAADGEGLARARADVEAILERWRDLLDG